MRMALVIGHRDSVLEVANSKGRDFCNKQLHALEMSSVCCVVKSRPPQIVCNVLYVAQEHFGSGKRAISSRDHKCILAILEDDVTLHLCKDFTRILVIKHRSNH
eukprot:XP_001705752.1 Hypothetical protein GL50803_103431 [Giardia lamblia ATCC 50803]